MCSAGKMHINIHKRVCIWMCMCTLKSKLHSSFPHRDTHMQWTQKQGQGISQSDPYHYLPCKAHLTGRPAAQTSAIFTHFVSCIRSPKLLHIECVKHCDTEKPKARQLKNRNAPGGSTNHLIQDQQTGSK